MIGAKDAVAAATAYMKEIYGTLPGLLVEEIELEEGNQYWLVTMGFWQTVPEAPQPTNQLAALFSAGSTKRVYKELKVDAHQGVVKYMKIRTLPSVPRA